MAGEQASFHERVRVLRHQWVERREVQPLASSHDIASQSRLLAMLYSWAEEALGDIRDIYGDDLHLELTPAPPLTSDSPGFTITIGNDQQIAFTLANRTRNREPGWYISATVSTQSKPGAPVPAGPQRRSGHWTRARFEELLLSALAAHERSVSGDSDPGT